MKKRIISILIVALFVFCALSGCNKPVECEHVWSDYVHDAQSHWKKCDNCGEIQPTQSHVIIDGRCSVCGYTTECQHVYNAEFESNQQYHYHVCKLCNEIGLMQNHVYVDGVCKYCQKSKPVESRSVNILGNVITQYLSSNTDKEIVSALLQNKGKISDAPIDVVISWEMQRDASKYLVQVTATDDFEDAINFETSATSLSLTYLTPKCEYLYRVIAYNGSTRLSTVDTARLVVADEYPLRQVGVSGVSNFRDLGGWQASGGKINYGKMYRGATLKNITSSGANVFGNILKIKTEIDLRYGGYNEWSSKEYSEMDGVNYVNKYIWQYTMIIPDFISEGATDNSNTKRGFDAQSPKNLKAIFELMADESNYPIYFHCSAGADRTGTLAFLVNGLCGVSWSDLCKDFELTSFSAQGARYRSAIDGDHFDDSGVSENTTGNYVAFGKMYELLMERYSNGGTLAQAIENYLKQECEISQETLNKVKEIMVR